MSRPSTADLTLAKETIFDLRPSTLALFTRDGEILLAMKKRGFGVGKWNGIGGKVMDEESVEAALVRETGEEIGAVPIEFDRVADLHFYSHTDPGQNWKVHVYIVTDWVGEIVESSEMKPVWIALANIPYTEMWDDDKHWLPEVLAGKKIEGHFLFSEEKKISEFEILPL